MWKKSSAWGGRWKEGRGGQAGAAEQTGWFVDREVPLHKKSDSLASATGGRARAPTLSQVLSSGSWGSICCCVWANGQVPAQLLLKLPLLWLGPKSKNCTFGPSWAHTVIFQVESRKVELKSTFWIGPCWGLGQCYMAPGGDSSCLQDGNQVCSCQWFKLLCFAKFNLGTSLQRMWGTSGIILLQAKRGEANFRELKGSLICKCLVPKQYHSDEQTCLQVSLCFHRGLLLKVWLSESLNSERCRRMRREDPQSNATWILSGMRRCQPATAAEGGQTEFSEGLRYGDSAHYQRCLLVTFSLCFSLSLTRGNAFAALFFHSLSSW